MPWFRTIKLTPVRTLSNELIMVIHILLPEQNIDDRINQFLLKPTITLLGLKKMISAKQCLFPDCCSYQTVLRPAIEASAVPYLIKCDINTFD